MKKTIAVLCVTILLLSIPLAGLAWEEIHKRMYIVTGGGSLNLRISNDRTSTIILYANNNQPVTATRYDSSVGMYYLLKVKGTKSGGATAVENGWAVEEYLKPESQIGR